MVEERLRKRGPVVKGSMVIFKCPACNSVSFIEDIDGGLSCADCSMSLTGLRRLGSTRRKTVSPSPVNKMEKGIDYVYIAGTTKDKVSILFSYLMKIHQPTKEQEVIKNYVKKIMFGDCVIIENDQIREKMKSILRTFSIPFNTFSEMIGIKNYNNF